MNSLIGDLNITNVLHVGINDGVSNFGNTSFFKFLSQNAAGHCIVMGLPLNSALASQAVDHYLSCKCRMPSQISALCALAHVNNALAYRLQHAGFQLVKSYDRGAPIVEGSNHAPWPVQIWYDPPLHVPALSKLGAEPQTMVFHGQVNSLASDILVDSGATHSFLSARLAHDLNLRVHPSPLKHAVLADSVSRMTIVGNARIRLRIGDLNVRVNVLVLDAPSDFDLILGDDFNSRFHTLLDWKTRTMSLTLPHTTRNVVIPMKTAGLVTQNATAPPTTTLARVITAKQAKRAIRKGAHATLYVVRPEWVPALRSERGAPMTFACAPKATTSGSNINVLSASESYPPAVQHLLDEFKDVFQPVPSGLPPDRGEGHTIPLIPGSKPTYRRMQRFSPNELAEVKKQLTELIEKGWIQPSSSPYSANVLFVTKKDGTLRMVYDYRALNAITIRNRYPLPRIDDLFDQLQGAKYLSSLDLQTGYNQIRIKPEDVPLTAFTTPFGHFEFKVLTFGLTNAPATFQALMNKIFSKYLGKFVLIYLDDVVVFSRTLEEHIEHLRLVLETLREQKLYAKLSKCTFAQPEIEYLGHIIGNGMIRADPRKVKVVLDWPQPKDVSALRSFLGLANYFRRFIENRV